MCCSVLNAVGCNLVGICIALVLFCICFLFSCAFVFVFTCIMCLDLPRV